MAFHKPDKMLNIALEAGVSKTKLSLSSILMLGFLGGAFIALGFLLDVRALVIYQLNGEVYQIF